MTAENIVVIATCLIFVVLSIGWMTTWDWGGRCSILSATERKAERA